MTHGYDDLERIATIHSSQGGASSTDLLAEYKYLGAGRVERRTLAGNGTQLDYGFDAIGRVNATTHALAATSAVFDERTYTWDKANNKTQRVELVASVPVKTYDYQYDALNRLKRSIKTVGAAAAGTAGNWTGAMTLDTVTPDAVDFMGGTPLQLDGTFSATFDPGTLQVFVTKVQGTRDEGVDYAADLQGYTATQIDALAPARPEQGTFDVYASALDGATRVYSDPKPITYGPHIIEYDLDGAGNREELATQAETAPDTYTDLATVAYTEDGTAPAPADAQMNQYTTVPEESSARLYDENGNLLTTDVAAFRHDYLDRIYDRDDGTVTATYLYDALGRRIEKTVDDGVAPVTTRYLYDGVRVAEEWDVPEMGAPTLGASYVYGNYIDEVLTMRRGSSDYYYHADDQFNVVKLTDNTGAVVEAYDFGDYGQPEFFNATGAVTAGTAYANPYLFTGRRWDAELGYYYFRNRYMDPVHGRFASRDPLGLWGDGANLGNGYTYAGSNPWSLVDPFGLAAGGNSFWGTFFSGIIDPETYGDYALYSYEQAALGLLDFGVELGELGTHFSQMSTNPFYGYEQTKNNLATAKVVLGDPVGTVTGMAEQFSEYVSDFDSRDAGKLLPDAAGALLGVAEVRAVRGASQALKSAATSVDAAADLVPKSYNWTPRAKAPLAAPGEDLFVGTYSKSYRANVNAKTNKTHTPHHSLQDAVSGTSRWKGVTINMRKALHKKTRTHGKTVEPGLSLRQHLARDVMDIRRILIDAGYRRTVINRQLQELIRQNKELGGLEKQ